MKYLFVKLSPDRQVFKFKYHENQRLSHTMWKYKIVLRVSRGKMKNTQYYQLLIFADNTFDTLYLILDKMLQYRKITFSKTTKNTKSVINERSILMLYVYK